MMKGLTFPRLLHAASIILLVYLAVVLMSDWDIAETKNRHLIYETKTGIDVMSNIDSVKVAAKKYIDIGHNNFRSRSEQSFHRFWIVISIIAMQAAIIVSRKTIRNKQP